MGRKIANEAASLLHKVECIKDYEGVPENAIMEDYCLDYFNRKNAFCRVTPVMNCLNNISIVRYLFILMSNNGK